MRRTYKDKKPYCLGHILGRFGPSIFKHQKSNGRYAEIFVMDYTHTLHAIYDPLTWARSDFTKKSKSYSSLEQLQADNIEIFL